MLSPRQIGQIPRNFEKSLFVHFFVFFYTLYISIRRLKMLAMHDSLLPIDSMWPTNQNFAAYFYRFTHHYGPDTYQSGEMTRHTC